MNEKMSHFKSKYENFKLEKNQKNSYKKKSDSPIDKKQKDNIPNLIYSSQESQENSSNSKNNNLRISAGNEVLWD